jgi:cytidyltransferase-like protein
MANVEYDGSATNKITLESLPHLDKEIFNNPESLALWRQFASRELVRYAGSSEERVVRDWLKTTEVEKNGIREGILFQEEIEAIIKHKLVYPFPWSVKLTKKRIPEHKYDSIVGLFDVSIPNYAEEGYIVGMTSGVFDVIHAGHLLYLKECRKHCDILVVGVDSNDVVQMTKGPQRPFNDFSVRVGTLSELREVNRLCRVPRVSLLYTPDPFPYMTLFYDIGEEALEQYRFQGGIAREQFPGWYTRIGPNLRFFITEGDPARSMKEVGAEYMGGKLEVIPRQTGLSSTRIAEHFDLVPSGYKPNRFGPDPWWIRNYQNI